MGGELSESFGVGVGVRQGCVMLPWLFNIYMDGCMRGESEGEGCGCMIESERCGAACGGVFVCR